MLKVLVACEESQTVCLAFRRLGHIAFSCDLQDCSGGFPQWHIKGDCLDYVYDDWDLIIAHPPCTYLSNAGSSYLFPKHELNLDRYIKGLAAKSFFYRFLNLPCPFVCVENPVPSKIFNLPPYSQLINPFEFGDPFKKRTCLWLKGLPPLMSTSLMYHRKIFISCHKDKGFARSPKVRSKTFPGIAAAMASQFGSFVEGFKHGY